MSELFCCYCLMPQGERIMCCLENHFVPFSDLDKEDQDALREE